MFHVLIQQLLLYNIIKLRIGVRFAGSIPVKTSGGIIVSVILDAPTGTNTLHNIFLLSPSLANVNVKPTIPAFAAA